MNLLLSLSQAIIPLLVFLIVGYGIAKKTPVYDNFIEGAKDGFHTVIEIIPTLVGLMVGVGVLRASGFLDFVTELFSNVTDYLHFPSALVPLAIVKMFSSSAATGLLLDLYKEYGADSSLGMIASLMMSSTETIFYTMSVYFLSVKITRTRWTLTGSLIATFAGLFASLLLGSLLF